MSESAFNFEALANTTVDTSLDTAIIPCPEGDFTATITKMGFRSTDKGSVMLDLTWKINDADGTVKAATSRDEVTVRQTIFLDMNGQNLDVSKGKNIGLGRVREAVGMNISGKAFKLGDLYGQMAKVKVSHRANPDNPEIKYDEIKHVSSL